MTDWLLNACALASMFLILRNSLWFIVLMQARYQKRRDWVWVWNQMQDVRSTPQWRLRSETLALCVMAWSAFVGKPEISLALLFWLVACRVVRWAEDRVSSVISLVGILCLAFIWHRGYL